MTSYAPRSSPPGPNDDTKLGRTQQFIDPCRDREGPVTITGIHSMQGPARVPWSNAGTLSRQGGVLSPLQSHPGGPVVIRSPCRTRAAVATDDPCRDIMNPPSRYCGSPSVGLWENEGQGRPCHSKESLSRRERPYSQTRSLSRHGITSSLYHGSPRSHVNK